MEIPGYCHNYLPLKKFTFLQLTQKRSLWLLFLFFNFIFFKTFGAELQFDELKSKIVTGNFYDDPVWMALLQVDNSHAQIHDSKFYVSSPFLDSQAELLEMVHQLTSKVGQATACQFPARYYWLKSKIDLPHYNLEACTDLAEFVGRAPMNTLSVVFASENLAQPSSIMGHIFLKLEGSNQNGIKVAHDISFFTQLTDINLPKLIFESLFTGKTGFYTLTPHEQSKNYYHFIEQRNLWEYQIKLDEFQRQLIHYYLFELKNISFTYYFHSYNCATLIRNILATAYPRLLNIKSLWVTPLDVVRDINKNNLIDSQFSLPSSRWKIKAFAENLNLTRDNVSKVINYNFEKLDLEKYTNNEKVLTYELALAYNDYQYEKDVISSTKWGETNAKLIDLRNLTLKNSEIDISNYKNPSATPQDSQIFSKINSYSEDTSYILGFLPASHMLLDDNSQYQNESELRIGEFSFAYKPSDKSFNLDSLILYSAISLQSVDSFTGGVSGLLRLGIEPRLAQITKYERTTFLEGGLGQTYRFKKDIDLYFLGLIGYQSEIASVFYFSPTLGMTIREIASMKTSFGASQEFRPNGVSFINLNVTQVYNTADYSLAIKYWQNKLTGPLNTLPNLNSVVNGYEIVFKKIF